MVCPKSWVDWLYTYLHPTVRSGWSHWVVMAAHHCYLWWCDTLWDSFGSHKVLWLHLWSCYHSQQLCKYLWSDLWQTFCLICHCPIGLVCGVWSLEMLSNLHLMVVISVQTILLCGGLPSKFRKFPYWDEPLWLAHHNKKWIETLHAPLYTSIHIKYRNI
jgi:hypothetical protein